MEEITAWWESVHQIMEKRGANIPVVCLGDFNAKLGSAVSEGCGDHAWDVEDDGGGLLRELVDRWGLLMPSTFSQYHEGHSATFVSSLGHKSRIDYILVSKDSQPGIIRSFVDMDMTSTGQGPQAVSSGGRHATAIHRCRQMSMSIGRIWDKICKKGRPSTFLVRNESRGSCTSMPTHGSFFVIEKSWGSNTERYRERSKAM